MNNKHLVRIIGEVVALGSWAALCVSAIKEKPHQIVTVPFNRYQIDGTDLVEKNANALNERTGDVVICVDRSEGKMDIMDA